MVWNMLNSPELSVGDHVKLSELTVPISPNEQQRLKTLRQSSVLSCNKESLNFDRHVILLSRILKAPITLISFTDVNTEWIMSKVGISAICIHRNHAFSSHGITADAPPVMVIPDTTQDTRFMNNPMVTSSDNIRFYAGASIVCRGERIGSMCIFDRQPRYDFGERQQSMLMDMASIVSAIIEERMIKLLEQEQQLARFVVATHYHLRRPIEDFRSQVSKFKKEVFSVLKYRQKDPSLARNTRKGNVSRSSIQDFRVAVQKLAEQVEVAVHTALLFDEAMDRLNAKPESIKQPFRASDAFFDLRRLSRQQQQVYSTEWDINSCLSTHLVTMDKNLPNKVIRCFMELAVFCGRHIKVSADLCSIKRIEASVFGEMYADAALELNVTYLSSPTGRAAPALSPEQILIAECCDMLCRTLVASAGGDFSTCSTKSGMVTLGTEANSLSSALLIGSPGTSILISLPCLCRVYDLDDGSCSIRSTFSAGELSFVSRYASDSTDDEGTTTDFQRSASAVLVTGKSTMTSSLTRGQSRSNIRKEIPSTLRQPEMAATKQVGGFGRLAQIIQAALSSFRFPSWKNKVHPLL